MREAADRYARVERVLSGALALWTVAGSLKRDGNALVVRAQSGRNLRIVPDTPHGWTVHDERGALGAHAGLSGLLRQLREELAPGAARGQLIIGAQSLR